jgi:hypothetical protein
MVLMQVYSDVVGSWYPVTPLSSLEMELCPKARLVSCKLFFHFIEDVSTHEAHHHTMCWKACVKKTAYTKMILKVPLMEERQNLKA